MYLVRLVSGIYKELLQLNKKDKQTNEKMGKGSEHLPAALDLTVVSSSPTMGIEIT